ncbi:hypothetical protein DBW_0566 [Desulfuromonas sp. DDH964]|nr:hypothetical protein DBW_0566 [Desulfuromonas sp. DDH964]
MMTLLLLTVWLVMIIASYKLALRVLERSGNL